MASKVAYHGPSTPKQKPCVYFSMAKPSKSKQFARVNHYQNYITIQTCKAKHFIGALLSMDILEEKQPQTVCSASTYLEFLVISVYPTLPCCKWQDRNRWSPKITARIRSGNPPNQWKKIWSIKPGRCVILLLPRLMANLRYPAKNKLAHHHGTSPSFDDDQEIFFAPITDPPMVSADFKCASIEKVVWLPSGKLT